MQKRTLSSKSSDTIIDLWWRLQWHPYWPNCRRHQNRNRQKSQESELKCWKGSLEVRKCSKSNENCRKSKMKIFKKFRLSVEIAVKTYIWAYGEAVVGRSLVAMAAMAALPRPRLGFSKASESCFDCWACMLVDCLGTTFLNLSADWLMKVRLDVFLFWRCINKLPALGSILRSPLPSLQEPPVSWSGGPWPWPLPRGAWLLPLLAVAWAADEAARPRCAVCAFFIQKIF